MTLTNGPTPLLFKYCSYKRDSQPFYEIFSQKSKLLHGIGNPRSSSSRTGHYLIFLPCYHDNRRFIIQSSFGDLLLPVPPFNIHAYYICNPVTKQWLSLPAAPISSPYTTGVPGLVCESKSMSQLCRYKVVWIQRFDENAKEYVVVAQIFCSETGKWSKSVLSFPWQSRRLHLCRSSKPVASNGTVHWLLEGPFSLQIKGILSIYLFDKIGTDNTSTKKHICRFINLPDGFRQGCRASVENLCLGVVKEQMRLSQLLREKKAGLVLRVCELKYSDNKNEEKKKYHGFWCMRVA